MPPPRLKGRWVRIYLPRSPIDPKTEMLRTRAHVERSTVERKIGSLALKEISLWEPFRYWRSSYRGRRVYLITHAEKIEFLRVYAKAEIK